MKNPWVIIGTIAVVLFGSAFWYASISAEKNNEGVEILSHVKGNPEAGVVLVEYSDLQCPACEAFRPIINDVIATYGEEVRFEYKHFPLPIHQYAVQAAAAAEAAGQQGKFFEYHDALFDNQQTWARSASPKILFLQYADELELDMDTFRRHNNASLLRDKVEDDFAEGRELGVSGTPTFFLNGERMVFTTYQEFIDQVGVAVDPSTATEVGIEVEPEVKFGL